MSWLRHVVRRVWIVEMREEIYNGRAYRWNPCVGISLTKADASAVLAQWRERNPDNKFRVTKYEAKP